MPFFRSRIASLVAVSYLLAVASVAAATRPNVILILADDLGYECLGANGGTSYQTPNLDRLAAEGVRFERCYAQPLCTPTRIQLMTGQYNVRNYVDFGHMDPSLKTFGNLFKEAGYATCIAGKWQLGRQADLPRKFGFDESCLWQHLRLQPRYANPGLEINGVEKDFSNGEYGPDLINDYVLDFVSRQKHQPFFVYYPLILTHAPYQATPDSKDWNPAIKGERKSRDPQHFADMVAYMDKLIGKLVAHLDAQGLRENTLILFLGDNGTGAGTISRVGDREVVGAKGKPYETGMRVPLIANWPKNISSGKVVADLVDTTDFLPTIAEAANVAIPVDTQIDGRSFLPQLRGERGAPREWIYSWYAPRRVLKHEFAADLRWKLYRTGAFFDIASDPLEQRPLDVSALSGDAADGAVKLRGVLEKFKDARPANLVDATQNGTRSGEDLE